MTRPWKIVMWAGIAFVLFNALMFYLLFAGSGSS